MIKDDLYSQHFQDYWIDQTAGKLLQSEATVLEGDMTNAEDANKDPENKTGGETTAEAAKVESGARTGIEQKPFLTQTELLIKMKKGEEEEVAR